MPGYPLPILEYCCTISNRLFGNKTRCTLHDIKPFLPAYLRTYAESALEEREIEHYRFHPSANVSAKRFRNFFLSSFLFQFFSPCLRKRIRKLIVAQVRNTRFEKHERRRGKGSKRQVSSGEEKGGPVSGEGSSRSLNEI